MNSNKESNFDLVSQALGRAGGSTGVRGLGFPHQLTDSVAAAVAFWTGMGKSV